MANPAYDHNHRQHRADWDQAIQAGAMPTCRRCSKPIKPGQPWQLGHIVDLALGGTPKHRAPEHKRCNEAAGGQLSAALRNQPPPSRNW